jgi:hypothetical protein
MKDTSHYLVFIVRGFMVWSATLEIVGFLAFAHKKEIKKYHNISGSGSVPLLS